MRPQAVLVGGANGAGKTTFARQVLATEYVAAAFLNADEIQRSDPSSARPMAAGRELLRRLDEMERSQQSFVVETTLASEMYARRLRRWIDRGYFTTLIS